MDELANIIQVEFKQQSGKTSKFGISASTLTINLAPRFLNSRIIPNILFQCNVGTIGLHTTTQFDGNDQLCLRMTDC